MTGLVEELTEGSRGMKDYFSVWFKKLSGWDFHFLRTKLEKTGIRLGYLG